MQQRKTDLPYAAQETLARVQSGGPFPYAQDGTIFRNREQKLPIHTDPEYYTEYTVQTSGAQHRGACRIVIGKIVKYITQMTITKILRRLLIK